MGDGIVINLTGIPSKPGAFPRFNPSISLIIFCMGDDNFKLLPCPLYGFRIVCEYLYNFTFLTILYTVYCLRKFKHYP